MRWQITVRHFLGNLTYLKYKRKIQLRKEIKKMKHIKKILIPAAIVGGITIVIAKLCKKDSADHIDLTLNDDDINEIEKEMVKEKKIKCPHKTFEPKKKRSWSADDSEIWDFGDLK